MVKVWFRLFGRVVLFSAYAAGFVLLTAGFLYGLSVSFIRLYLVLWLLGDDEWKEEELAHRQFKVFVNGFERAARAMAFGPVVTKGRRSWRF